MDIDVDMQMQENSTSKYSHGFQFHLRIRKDFNDRIRKILHEVIKHCFPEFIIIMHTIIFFRMHYNFQPSNN